MLVANNRGGEIIFRKINKNLSPGYLKPYVHSMCSRFALFVDFCLSCFLDSIADALPAKFALIEFASLIFILN